MTRSTDMIHCITVHLGLGLVLGSAVDHFSIEAIASLWRVEVEPSGCRPEGSCIAPQVQVYHLDFAVVSVDDGSVSCRLPAVCGSEADHGGLMRFRHSGERLPRQEILVLTFRLGCRGCRLE